VYLPARRRCSSRRAHRGRSRRVCTQLDTAAHHARRARLRNSASPRCRVILATAERGLVRAAMARASGYGVGPGNVPASYRTHRGRAQAVADIIAGKTFDYGTICPPNKRLSRRSRCANWPRGMRRQERLFLFARKKWKVGRLLFCGNAYAEYENRGSPGDNIAGWPGSPCGRRRAC